MSDGQRVRDVMSAEEYEDLLDSATSMAESDEAIKFCDDMHEKYNEWGDGCYLSSKQLNWLEKLAGVER